MKIPGSTAVNPPGSRLLNGETDEALRWKKCERRVAFLPIERFQKMKDSHE
jgi:hypothetical protein